MSASALEEVTMPGIIVFKTLADAVREGYELYDRTVDGFLVRRQTVNGWAFALVAGSTIS